MSKPPLHIVESGQQLLPLSRPLPAEDNLQKNANKADVLRRLRLVWVQFGPAPPAPSPAPPHC